MVRKFVQRGAVLALGLVALTCAAFSTAPTQVGAVDYFTAVGCNQGDYTCLYARNGINPNAPQLESPRVYYQSLGYYGYGSPYYGANYSYSYPSYGNSYGYGYGYSNPYYGYGYGYGNPYYGYGNFYTGGSVTPQNIAQVTGYCNLGYGQTCGGAYAPR